MTVLKIEPSKILRNSLFLILSFCFGFSFADTTHLVQKGETLYSISRKYELTVQELRTANNLSEKDVLKAGQKLIIPTADIENAAALAASPTAAASSYDAKNLDVYVAQKGDTYYGIARKNNINVAELFSINGLSSDSVLKAGQKLKVPAKVAAASSSDAMPALKDADPRKYTGKTSSSTLDWPVKNPKVTYVTGKVSGVQLSASNKEKVTNIMSGTVMYCGFYRGYGEVIFVQSKTGLIYAYTGLSGIKVKKGEYVVYGDELGSVGVDSITNSPTLTLMVFRNGTPIDPAKAPRG